MNATDIINAQREEIANLRRALEMQDAQIEALLDVRISVEKEKELRTLKPWEMRAAGYSERPKTGIGLSEEYYARNRQREMTTHIPERLARIGEILERCEAEAEAKKREAA